MSYDLLEGPDLYQRLLKAEEEVVKLRRQIHHLQKRMGRLHNVITAARPFADLDPRLKRAIGRLNLP